MFRRGFDGGVHHQLARTELVIVFITGKPICRIFRAFRHGWFDQFRVRQDIFHLALVCPDAKDTAGAVTFVQPAAPHRRRFEHAGIDPFFRYFLRFFHCLHCTTRIRAIGSSLQSGAAEESYENKVK